MEKIKLYADHTFRPGDVIAFSGAYWDSYLINLVTYGVPGFSVSHVGIVGDGGTVLYEATGAGGVIYRPITPLNYSGRVWHYPLAEPLRAFEKRKLHTYLASELGKPYDTRGAYRAGAKCWATIMAKFHTETRNALFCSEYVARALHTVGRFDTRNTSCWSPNAFIREGYKRGIFLEPFRLQ